MSVVSSELGISWQEAGLVVFALGSIIGRTVLVRTTLAGAVIGLTAMFAAHATMSRLYRGHTRAYAAIQNPPILLVADGQLLPDQLRRARLARFELRQLLRQQGHGAFEGLRAVVLEPTGSVSVVPAGAPISEEFLTEVAGGHRLEMH